MLVKSYRKEQRIVETEEAGNGIENPDGLIECLLKRKGG
jgi:hypothetical protein